MQSNPIPPPGTIPALLSQARQALEQRNADDILQKFTAIARLIQHFSEANKSECQILVQRFYVREVVNLDTFSPQELSIHSVCIRILGHCSANSLSQLFSTLSERSRLGSDLIKGDIELEKCIRNDILILQDIAQNAFLHSLVTSNPAAFLALLGRCSGRYPHLSVQYGERDYCIRCPRSQSILNEVLTPLKATDLLKRFTFMCADSPVVLPFIFLGHLARDSKFLNGLISSVFKEAKEAASQLVFPCSVVTAVLDHLALEGASLPEWQENILECYDCAQFLQCDSLMEKYEKLIIQAMTAGHLDLENQLAILNLISTTNRAEFKDKILKVIMNSLQSCQSPEQFDPMLESIIQACPNLDYFLLERLPLLQDRHLEPLTRLSELRQLTLNDCPIITLPMMRQIRRLSLFNCKKLANVQSFCQDNPALRALDIVKCRAQSIWTAIRFLTELRELSFTDCFISQLSLPKSLQILKVNGALLANANFFISDSPTLPIVILFLPRCTIKPDQLNALLMKCKNSLKCLDLSHCPTVNLQTLQLIAECPELEELRLDGCPVYEESVIRKIVAKKPKGIPKNWMALLD